MLESIRVLYVEDDVTDRDLTRSYLEREAAHVKLTTVETLAEARDRLAVGDMDLALVDYRLPDGTGLHLLDTIKTIGPPLPVVILTGAGDADAAVRLLKAGADEYVVKRPDYLATLPRILDETMQAFRSTQELRRTPLSVLYAEDDRVDVELTQRALRDSGLHVRFEAVPRATDALERLRTTAYDLFLLDYRLPDMTAIEVLKSLREEGLRIPVVIVTGLADEDAVVQAFKLGVADYVVKRHGYLGGLPGTLERVLAQRRQADENAGLVVLNKLAQSIATVQDPTELASLAATAARALLKVEMSVLWLLTAGELVPAAWNGMPEAAAATLRFPVTADVAERATRERQLDARQLVGSDPALATFAAGGYSVIVPLVAAGRLTGALGVTGHVPRQLRPAEERLLVALADHAAIALDNTRVYRQLRDQFAELERTQAQLVQTEKLASMGSLLANVAHELNNPLMVIAGRAGLLHQMVAEDEQRREVESIQQSASRCAQIVRSFLALARQQMPRREEVSLTLVVRQALESLADALRADGVTVEVELEKDLPTIQGDAPQLYQVVLNLITNAHQAMRGTPLPHRLTVSTGSVPAIGRVRLEVTDSGPGVATEICDRIFEPFFTTKPMGQGTGLGLAICLGIVDTHHGSIRMESPPGQGARFIVELPIDSASDLQPTPSRPPAARGRRSATILLVDDEPGLLSLLGRVLIGEGHRVELAADGLAALDKLQHRDYDLIFCDIGMPRMDGRAFYRHLQRRRPDHLPRIVFITGERLTPRRSSSSRRPASAV